MSYNTPGLGIEEEDNPFGVPGYDGIPDPFGGADELAEIVWQKGPVAKQFTSPSTWSPVMPRGQDADERYTGAAPQAAMTPRLFIEEDEMVSWLYLPQDVTGGSQNAIPLTELGRQPTALAAEGVSRMEATARIRESTEVGSSATPDAERALPAVSGPITAVDSNRFPRTCEDDGTAAAPAASSSGGGGGVRRMTHVIEERKRKTDDSDDSDAEV